LGLPEEKPKWVNTSTFKHPVMKVVAQPLVQTPGIEAESSSIVDILEAKLECSLGQKAAKLHL
jgi:hypothetical protein